VSRNELARTGSAVVEAGSARTVARIASVGLSRDVVFPGLRN
jgi:hypothetical protein